MPYKTSAASIPTSCAYFSRVPCPLPLFIIPISTYIFQKRSVSKRGKCKFSMYRPILPSYKQDKIWVNCVSENHWTLLSNPSRVLGVRWIFFKLNKLFKPPLAWLLSRNGAMICLPWEDIPHLNLLHTSCPCVCAWNVQAGISFSFWPKNFSKVAALSVAIPLPFWGGAALRLLCPSFPGILEVLKRNKCSKPR